MARFCDFIATRYLYQFYFQILAMADLRNSGHFVKQSFNNLNFLNTCKKFAPSTPSKAVNFSSEKEEVEGGDVDV